MSPATSFTIAMRESTREPSQRSIASVSARRTRLSSNGFFSWLNASTAWQFHGLSWIVTLGPSAWARVSRSPGVKPRNWMCARSLRIAATWAAGSRTISIR